MPPRRLNEWATWNQSEILSAGATVFLVCDEDTPSPETAFPLVRLVYPSPLPIFSITKTGNYGIRSAVEAGFDVVMKTDVDVVFLGNLATILNVDDFTAHVPKYGDVQSYETRNSPRGFMPDGQGTICLTARNWGRLQGYDERFSGWGRDDNEMCERIAEAGILVYSGDVVAHIEHGIGGSNWNEKSFNPQMGVKNAQIPVRQSGSQPNWGRG